MKEEYKSIEFETIDKTINNKYMNIANTSSSNLKLNKTFTEHEIKDIKLNFNIAFMSDIKGIKQFIKMLYAMKQKQLKFICSNGSFILESGLYSYKITQNNLLDLDKIRKYGTKTTHLLNFASTYDIKLLNDYFKTIKFDDSIEIYIKEDYPLYLDYNGFNVLIAPIYKGD